jgi:benzoyl-CoA reductase subunit D
MVTAGIDSGAKTVKVVVMGDGSVLGKSLIVAGGETASACEEAYDEALRQAGVRRQDVHKVCATGSGKALVGFRNDVVTEVGASGKGSVYFFPQARTVIDVGAEEGRAIRVDETGKVLDFVINEKCAAGAGAFVEAMARALELSVDEIGRLSLEATGEVCIDARCTVFAEREVISLAQNKTPKPDMARAIHDAIADRIVSMVMRVGPEPEILLAGGMAKNVGFVHAVGRALGMTLSLPDDPEFVGAVGAALVAAE